MQKYIDLICGVCGKPFSRQLKQYKYQLKISGKNYTPICSKECMSNFKKTKKKVTCATCGKQFEKQLRDIKKSKNDFCSHHCSAAFNNQLRKKETESVKTVCKYCNNTFLKRPASNKQVCNNCRDKKNKEIIFVLKEETKINTCITCGADIVCKRFSNKKYCDPCRKIFYHNLGKRIGLLSVTAQNRRSKNEIYFAQLCQQAYDTVTTNEQFFKSPTGNWDADIIIHKYKLAILWNGIWHYRSIRKNGSLKQIQSRDRIKLQVIKNNGYVPYIIKDMGKHDKKFVENKFNELKLFILSNFK